MTAFTTTEQLDRLYDLTDKYHEDDLPGITYTETDASDEYLAWIDAQTDRRDGDGGGNDGDDGDGGGDSQADGPEG